MKVEMTDAAVDCIDPQNWGTVGVSDAENRPPRHSTRRSPLSPTLSPEYRGEGGRVNPHRPAGT